MNKKAFLLLTLLSLLLSACNTFNQEDPIAIVEQYFSYWNNEDVEGIMSMLDDEPEIEVDLGVYLTDKEKIRISFVDLFERNDFQIAVSDFEVDGNTVTYNYQIFVENELNEQGRSQAVIENGKIKSERYIGQFIP